MGLGDLIRYKGYRYQEFKDIIWKITALDENAVVISDMKGTSASLKLFILNKDFEIFTPTDEPQIVWKTKYLGVVQ